MAQYTVLSNTHIQTILAKYGIENISSHRVLSGGSENTNYLVQGHDWAYVLTICEQKVRGQGNRISGFVGAFE